MHTLTHWWQPRLLANHREKFGVRHQHARQPCDQWTTRSTSRATMFSVSTSMTSVIEINKSPPESSSCAVSWVQEFLIVFLPQSDSSGQQFSSLLKTAWAKSCLPFLSHPTVCQILFEADSPWPAWTPRTPEFLRPWSQKMQSFWLIPVVSTSTCSVYRHNKHGWLSDPNSEKHNQGFEYDPLGLHVPSLPLVAGKNPLEGSKRPRRQGPRPNQPTFGFTRTVT